MSTFELPSAPMNATLPREISATETSQVARLLWLRSLFGAQTNERPVEMLAARMTEVFLPRGAELYVRGGTSDSIYFVVEGVIRQGTHGYTRYVSGDVLGFVDGMIDRPHQYTAVVLEDAVVLRLRLEDWFELLEEHFSVLRGMFTNTGQNSDAYPDPVKAGDALIRAEIPIEGNETPASTLVRHLLAVKSCPLFERASIQAVVQLVRGATVLCLDPGAVLPEANKRPGLFIQVYGKISFAIGPVGEAIEAKTHAPGSLVGSISLVPRVPGVFDLEAEARSEILFIESEKFFDVMEDHFDVGRSALAYVARRLDDRNQRSGPPRT